MMSKKKNNKAAKSNPNSVEVECYENEDEQAQEAKIAATYLRPMALSAATIKSHYKENDLVNVNALIRELNLQVKNVNEGDLSRPEAMLVSQAHALDHLFATLMLKAQNNMGEHFEAAERLMKLALKTQGQCRMTIEALAEIKNPKPYIQHNKAKYQQVNNGADASRTRGEKQKQANELLEDCSDEWMDAGAQKETIGDDKELETVGEQHRSNNARGQEHL